MEKVLSVCRAATQITGTAVFLDLGDGRPIAFQRLIRRSSSPGNQRPM